MGLTLIKKIVSCDSRGPLIIPDIPSFSKRGFDKYVLHCIYSRALDSTEEITTVNAYAYDTDNNDISSTVIGTKVIGTENQAVDVTVQAGTVALSPIKILVQVSTATEQSELEATMTISADSVVASPGLEMEGALQMDGELEMEAG